ncbi:MAG TPA: BrnT family toxin [Candidatus Thermoplasmatota archaeon]
MRRLRWNPEKNEALKAERGISFERIVLAVADRDVLDVLRHPNEARYPNQRVLVVAVEGYAYLVPYVEEPDGYFLKTVIPSRRATREYLSG